MLGKLNGAEQAILDAVETGAPCHLAGNVRSVRAEALRAMLLQIRDPAIPASHYETNCHRWVIEGAAFEERLDLSDARLPGGGALPALEFVGCLFRDGFSGEGGRFERLSFESCVFVCHGSGEEEGSGAPPAPIRLRNASVSNELLFRDLRPYSDDSFLSIDASAVRTGTHLTLKDVFLRAPEGQEVAVDGSGHYALDLAGTVVGGSLNLQPGVTALGGIRLRSGRIGGDLWASGIHLSDGETGKTRPQIRNPRFALNCQNAQVGGNLRLSTYDAEDRTNETIPGHLWLWGVSIKGGLYLYGIQLEKEFWLDLSNADIQGDVVVSYADLPMSRMPPLCSLMRLSGCRIGGELQIGGEVGDLSMEGCRVGGDLYVRGEIRRLEARRIQVAGDTTLASHVVREWPLQGLRSVDFTGAHFAGVLNLSRLRLYGPEAQGQARQDEKPGLVLHGARVETTLSLTPFDPLFERAKRAELVCWPGYSVIELEVRKNHESDADRNAWEGQDRAYVTFLHAQGSGESALITGQTFSDRSETPLSRLVRPAIEKMDPENAAAWADYLRLFCSSLWTAEYQSFFATVEDKSHLPPSLRRHLTLALGPIRLLDPDDPWKVQAPGEGRYFEPHVGVSYLSFKTHLHALAVLDLAVMRVYRNGAVLDASEEESVFKGSSLVTERRRYELPYRFGEDAARPDYVPLLDSPELLGREAFEALIPDWREKLNPRHRFANVAVDLRDASCTTLQDAGGAAWEAATIRMENFTYSRFSTSQDESGRQETASDQADLRRRWLRRGPAGEAFEWRRYAQLARVLREQGDEESARKVEKEKLQQQLTMRIRGARDPLSRLGWAAWNAVYGGCFQYGLGYRRAVIALLACWLVGTAGVWESNRHGLLVASASAGAAAKAHEGEPKSAAGGAHVEQPCGRSINSFLYAVETFTPLLNLHEVSRCEIRQPEPQERVVNASRVLEFFKFVYELLGYVMTSLAVLTFSGIARRWDQG